MDIIEIEEMFASLGPVSIRKMFGGKGIYRDGRIVAIELRGEILLKGDAENAAAYESAGSKRWTYTHNKTGKAVSMPYWTLPEGAMDDLDDMARWAALAWEAALRAK